MGKVREKEMIYTGYYAKLKKYEEAGLTPISIAGKAPEFYKGVQYKKFAPSWHIFSRWKKKEIENFQYTLEFKREILDNLNKEEIKEFLLSFTGDIILLCYEKSGDFCHRHIVAEWLTNEVGLETKEYKIK